MKIKVGTRESRLAIKQTEQVISAIKSISNIECEIVKYKTTGDKIPDKNLYEIGGKGLFLKELEEGLLRNEIDIAVHSYKDVPGIIDKRLQIFAVLEREEARDVLLSYDAKSIKDLPKNSIVGTCSPRRRVQILDIRPDIEIVDLRGNIENRINKFKEGKFNAIILAGAGLNRLELFDNDFCTYIDNHIMIPAVGQGTIAIEALKNRGDLYEILDKINHNDTLFLSRIERDFLENLNADCSSPVACYARREGSLIIVDFMFADYHMNFIERESLIFAHNEINNLNKIGRIIAQNMLHKKSSI